MLMMRSNKIIKLIKSRLWQSKSWRRCFFNHFLTPLGQPLIHAFCRQDHSLSLSSRSVKIYVATLLTFRMLDQWLVRIVSARHLIDQQLDQWSTPRRQPPRRRACSPTRPLKSVVSRVARELSNEKWNGRLHMREVVWHILVPRPYDFHNFIATIVKLSKTIFLPGYLKGTERVLIRRLASLIYSSLISKKKVK
jgi:hypothetical protein